MPYIKLDAVLTTDTVESYILFREIEDWCSDNIPGNKWKFQYSPTICVQGVDIPGRIIFKSTEDFITFKLRFNIS